MPPTRGPTPPAALSLSLSLSHQGQAVGASREQALQVAVVVAQTELQDVVYIRRL